MKSTFALAALFVLPALSMFAEDAQKPRRLESVTWDSVKHELTWVVSNGEKKAGAADQDGYKPVAQEKYIINMDNATMTFHDETRRFSDEEAKRVHTLMDLIAKYAVESTVWWEEGQGVKVDGKEDVAPGRSTAFLIPPCPDRLSSLLVAYSPIPHQL